MVAMLFEQTGRIAVPMEFNFRAATLDFFHCAPRSADAPRRTSGLLAAVLANRLMRALINLVKLAAYLPIVSWVFWRKSRRCSKVYIGGGNLLMGIEHGFPLQALTYVLLSRLFRKPVSFLCVGAGPFTAPGVRPLLRLALRGSDRVICRDSRSRDLIRSELGEHLTALEVLPDPVLIWPQPGQRAERTVDVLFTVMPLFSPAIFPDGNDAKAGNFESCLVELISSLIKRGNKVGMLVTDSGVDLKVSTDIADRVMANTGHRPTVAVPASPEAMAAVVSSAGLVFSTRMHGAIMALSQSVPALCVGWQPKVRGLYSDLEMNDLLVEFDAAGRFEIGDMLRRITEVLDTRHELIDAINARRNSLQATYRARWAEL